MSEWCSSSAVANLLVLTDHQWPVDHQLVIAALSKIFELTRGREEDSNFKVNKLTKGGYVKGPKIPLLHFMPLLPNLPYKKGDTGENGASFGTWESWNNASYSQMDCHPREQTLRHWACCSLLITQLNSLWRRRRHLPSTQEGLMSPKYFTNSCNKKDPLSAPILHWPRLSRRSAHSMPLAAPCLTQCIFGASKIQDNFLDRERTWCGA